MFGAQQAHVSGYGLPPEPSAPVFQDAWTPPDDAAEMETGSISTVSKHGCGKGFGCPSNSLSRANATGQATRAEIQAAASVPRKSVNRLAA